MFSRELADEGVAIIDEDVALEVLFDMAVGRWTAVGVGFEPILEGFAVDDAYAGDDVQGDLLATLLGFLDAVKEALEDLAAFLQGSGDDRFTDTDSLVLLAGNPAAAGFEVADGIGNRGLANVRRHEDSELAATKR